MHQSIGKAISALRIGFRWSMAMGDTSFWYEDWLGTGKLCDKAPFVHIHDSNLGLRDIRRNGDWEWDVLWTSLPHETCVEIGNFPISEDLCSVEGWFWEDSNSKLYSASAGYA